MTEVVTISFSICGVGGEDAIWLVVGWLMCDDVTMSDEKKTITSYAQFFILLCTILARLFGLSAFLDKKIDAMTIERDPIEPTLGRV
jgi:hypothetical protein